jgi:hypothetical protein
MNSDFVRIAIIGAVALALYYLVTTNLAIKNQGELNQDVELPEGYQQQTAPRTLPTYQPGPPASPVGVNRAQVMSNNFAQPGSEVPVQVVQPGQDLAKASQLNIVQQNKNVLPYPQISNNYGPQQATVVGQFGIKTGAQPSLDCFPKDTVTPQELMPREDPNNTWSQVNPSVGGHLSDRNFLESGYLFGIDTVSSSLRNANLGLRSDPVIPQIAVGPWSQSTISPDTNKRMFEIGSDY